MSAQKENPQRFATVGGSNIHPLDTLSSTHDVHRAISSCLSQPIVYTVFPDVEAKTKREISSTWSELVDMLKRPPEHPTKSTCQLLKGARFGDDRTAKGCLRSDQNVGAVSFIEGDYDDEAFTFDEAVAALKEAGVEAVIYTTASHSLTRQRYRILALLSHECPPSARSLHVATLNGAMGGRLAAESFANSQAFYFGAVAGVEYRCVHVAGTPVDMNLFLAPIYPSTLAKTYDSEFDGLPQSVDEQTVADLSAAVRALHPRRAQDYVECVAVMQHLKHLEHCGHGATAEAIALEFCQRSDKFSADWFERKWSRQLHPWHGHFKTLFALAQADGWVNPRKAITAQSLIRTLSSQTREVVLSTWAMQAAALTPTDAADLLAAVHQQTGVKLRALNSALKLAKGDLKRERKHQEAGKRLVLQYRPQDSVQQAALVEREILKNAPPEDLFLYAGRPSRMVDAEVPHAHRIGDPNSRPDPVPLIEAHTDTTMRAAAEKQVVFQLEGANGPVNIGQPPHILSALLEMPSPAVPRISGTLGHAVVLPDGSILDRNGLDPKTHLFLHGLPAVAYRPYDQIEAAAAFARLTREFLAGFEFASELMSHIAIAGLMTGVQRRLLDSAPGLAIMAPSQSSGKTTLARRIHIILTGRDMPVLNLPIGDEAEIEKRLLAQLMGSPEMLTFDNITDGFTVHGGAINGAMTSPIFEGRQLGSTKVLRAPTNVLFVLTGNNLRLGPDEVTRWLSTTLAPSTARPEERKFENGDVFAHARSIRNQVLADVVGIVAGYLLSGSRATTGIGTRFAQWDQQVRQPIVWAGGRDVALSFALNSEDSEQAQALRILLIHLADAFGNERFTARDVANLAAGIGAVSQHVCDAIVDALEALNARNPRSAKSVGRVLRGHLDRAVEVRDRTLMLQSRIDGNDISSYVIQAHGVCRV